MKKEEKLIGEFYGLHHDIYDHYRIKDFELKVQEKFIKGILNKHAIPNIAIEKMAFMEAGGSGNKARAMAKAGCNNVCFIDLSKENTDFVNDWQQDSKHPINVMNASILDTHSQLNNKFDIINCTGVVQHTTDPALCLMHLHNFLKINGLLIVNFYQSGTLSLFWIYLIRELVSSININYKDLINFSRLYKVPIDEIALLDHALVPIIQPTNTRIFLNDLKKIGFSVLENESCKDICHNRIDGMSKIVIAKKTHNENIELDKLEYRSGIDQLSLDYDNQIKNLIDNFFSFKEKCMKQKNVETTIILAILNITSIFQDTKKMKIDIKTLNVKNFFYKMHSLAYYPKVRNIFIKPEQYFYKRLAHLFKNNFIEENK